MPRPDGELMGDTTPTTRPAFAWGVSTHSGKVRPANEDSFVAEPMVLGIADGMGGHQAGEVASEIAVDVLRERLGAGARNVDVVVAAVVEANASIFHAANTNAAQRGMGTTLTAVALLRDTDDDRYGGDAEHLVLVNVGDSRTYVRRSGQLRRASIDHSYVQELVATGHITETEARTHPRRNIVTRALGIEPTVRVDTWVLPLVRGDRYVLCSDGLVDEVPDDEIDALLAEHDDPQAAADRLVDLANDHGGRDNVTVIVVDVLVGAEPPTGDYSSPFDQPAGATFGDGADDIAIGTLADELGHDLSGDLDDIDGGVRWSEDGMANHDRTASDRTAGDRANGDRANGDRAASDRTAGDRADGDRAGPDGGLDDSDRAADTDEGIPAATALLAGATAANAAAAAPIAPVGTGTGTGRIATSAVAAADGRPKRRRFTLGAFLFFLALAAIVTLTVVFVAVAVRNDNSPSPAITVLTTSTVAETTTTATTTTAIATTSPAINATTPAIAPVPSPPTSSTPASAGGATTSAAPG